MGECGVPDCFAGVLVDGLNEYELKMVVSTRKPVTASNETWALTREPLASIGKENSSSRECRAGWRGAQWFIIIKSTVHMVKQQRVALPSCTPRSSALEALLHKRTSHVTPTIVGGFF